MKYSVRSDSELIVTLFAVEKVFAGFQRDRRAITARAFRAYRPA